MLKTSQEIDVDYSGVFPLCLLPPMEESVLRSLDELDCRLASKGEEMLSNDNGVICRPTVAGRSFRTRIGDNQGQCYTNQFGEQILRSNFITFITFVV